MAAKNKQQRNYRLFKLVREGDISHLTGFLKDNYVGTDWKTELQEKSGDSVLHVATRHGHLPLLRWLVEDMSFSVSVANHDGKTALHESAQFSQSECLNYLLENGACVDCLKRADWTPLMLACTKSSREAVAALVRARANLKLKNKDGWNCFHIACREGHTDIVEHLLDQDADLWRESSKNGRTPLHTAALHGRTEVTRILILRGGYPPDPQDSCGSTPFMDSLRNGHMCVAELLISQHQADVLKKDNLGRTAVHLAAQVGCQDSVVFLVSQLGVNINLGSAVTGTTALHLAAKEGQHVMVSLLCSLGAVVQCVDHNGRTALHQACGGDHIQCVKALLSHGASDIQDSSGRSAQSLSQSPIIRELLESGS